MIYAHCLSSKLSFIIEWQYSSSWRHQSILHIKAAFTQRAPLHLRLSVSAGFLTEQVLQCLHYMLVSTKQMIFLLESGRITMCKSLFTVCVCMYKWSLKMCRCVWYKEENKHKAHNQKESRHNGTHIVAPCSSLCSLALISFKIQTF